MEVTVDCISLTDSHQRTTSYKAYTGAVTDMAAILNQLTHPKSPFSPQTLHACRSSVSCTLYPEMTQMRLVLKRITTRT